MCKGLGPLCFVRHKVYIILFKFEHKTLVTYGQI